MLSEYAYQFSEVCKRFDQIQIYIFKLMNS